MANEIGPGGERESLIRAIEDNLEDCCRSFAGLGQAEVHDDSQLVYLLSGRPGTFFNCVARTRLAAEQADAQIAATVARFKARGVAGRWWVTPSARPADLRERLAAHGFNHAHDAPGMALDLRWMNQTQEPSLPANVHVEYVTGPALLDRWQGAFEREFPMSAPTAAAWHDTYAEVGFGPGHQWQHFVAIGDDEPFATASLCLARGIAGVYHIGTVPEARRQGIGAAVTLAALQFARDLGYEVAVLQSTAAGVPLYLKLGFVQCCTLGFYTFA